MLEGETRIGRNPRVEFRGLEGGEGGVLLHLDTGAYYGVNEAGGLIWTLLDDIAFQDLLEELRKRLNDVPPTLDQDISEFIEALAARDLVGYKDAE